MALANTVYLSAMGKNGLRAVAEISVRNTQYAMKVLTDAGAKVKYPSRVFGEFVLELPGGKDATQVMDKLLDRKILAGLPLGSYYPELSNCLLVAVTERRTRAQIEGFGVALGEVLA